MAIFVAKDPVLQKLLCSTQQVITPSRGRLHLTCLKKSYSLA